MSASRQRLALRLQRVDEHIAALENRIQAFIEDRETYAESVQQDSETGEIVVFIEALHEPPITEWGVLIGDVVHNLRSTLDNLVWDLSVDCKGPAPPDPIPRRNPWRSVTFPIWVDGTGWPADGPKQLGFVDPLLIPIFHDAQPFNTGQHAADREPLAQLDELANIDKHRHPSLVFLWTEADRGEMFGLPLNGQEGLKFLPTWISDVRELPLNTKVEVARLRANRPVIDGGTGVDVHHNFMFEIAFDHGSPCFGGDAIDTLKAIKDAVTGVVVKFEPYLP